MLIIWHNNGDKKISFSNAGYCEYKIDEIEKEGGLENFIKKAIENGFEIFKIEFFPVN